MVAKPLSPGDIVVIQMPQHLPRGTEQEGQRPVLVVGIPQVLGDPRFPLVLVVPLTTDRQQTWSQRSPELYPKLPRGTAGLTADSVVLLDQLRAVSIDRTTSYLGTLPSDVYTPIQGAINRMIGSP